MGRRVAFSLAIRRFMLLAPIISLGIQGATLALVGAPYLNDLGVAPRFGVPTIFLSAIGAVLLAAWIWVARMHMNEADREAVRELDPYQKNRLTPKEAALLALVVDYLDGELTAEDLRGVAAAGRVEDP